ncbi:Acyl-CoA:1-acyl-sn-glycerol-3-phosphate acyltransferase [hydrothermal vent metagenome]|uniref:Acyl-CoA:1-acyl-sn-glycerol-3-phosphate acyltransferase n=1 Tax=hydrothermal vent metagenome TaxID=652676 RepID=A0A3B1CBU3_9ZZZZ
MKRTTEYENIIAAKDEYTSPPVKGRKFPELRFYSHLLKVFIRANIQCKKNIYDRYEWVKSSRDIMLGLEKIGVRFHITGMDNFKNINTPVVFIGNHMSTLETLVLPCIINPVKLVVFVTKKELTTMPLFGPINNARHPVVVGRSNARDDLMLVMEQGAQRIKDGRSIILFPQRTRSKIFKPSEFNTLGTKLAKRNNIPIIPLALLTDAWSNGKVIKEIGDIDQSKTVHFAFGKPLAITGNGAEQHKAVVEFIKTHLKEWGREEYIAET